MATSTGQDLTYESSSASDNNAFTTGMSWQSAIHSTPQRNPSRFQQYNEYVEPSMHDSDQEPSIELGRGVKRGARNDFVDDRSSHLQLSFGNDDSIYNIADTPPARPRTSQRRSDGALRKEAAIRRATESAKTSDTMKRSSNSVKTRAVSEGAQQEYMLPQHNANINVRASRFTSSRQVSEAHATSVPTRFTAHGGLEFSNQTATAFSATYNTSQTNQSFMLPDLSNINELVMGVRKDGTPAPKRASRSRFTSASYNSQPLMPVNGVAVPDDEKAIYASLKILKGRLTQLELENSEAQKRAEEYEAEVINLRSQVNVGTTRPDSGLGSDDDTLGPEKTKLQASVQALQDHISRYERKIEVSQIAIGRITKERDALITQIGQAYFRSEELAEENDAFRQTQAHLVAENEELRGELEQLKSESLEMREELDKLRSERLEIREELNQLKAQQSYEKSDVRKNTSTSKSKTSRKSDRDVVEDIAGGAWNFAETRVNGENNIRNRKEERTTTNYETKNTRHKMNERSGDASARDMAARIEREIQKLREEAAMRESRSTREQSQRSSNLRSRSRSQHRRSTSQIRHSTSTSSKANYRAATLADRDDTELTGSENEATASTQRQEKVRAAEKAQVEQDLTVLSELDYNLAATLRKKLEEERRSRHTRHDRTQTVELDQTSRSATRRSLPLPRKSSMKDITSGAAEGTGRISIGGKTIEELIKTAKTVRVQSPHSSDANVQPQQPEITEIEDTSMLSNTSRRRRRTGSTEGMTSAFILPDITIQGVESLNLEKTCIRHNAASCTACESATEKVDIPTPVPVTERDLEDVTNATIRPAQPPSEALAMVIKNLEDEIVHLKMQKEVQNQAYNQHDPSLSRHKRLAVKAEIDRLMAAIDKRCDQVYALFDVLEGQKQQEANAQEEEIDESVEVGMQAPADRIDDDDFSGLDSDELPWEGLSEADSDV